MKKISIAILAIIAIIAIIVACQKTPEVNLEYVDVERDLITVGTTTATIQCDYEYIATLKKAYLYYGEGEDAAEMASIEMRVVQKTLYVELSGLKENTTYSYYYEFANGFNSMRSATKTFKTEAGGSGGGDEPPTPSEITLPTVITAEVSEITTNSAQCGGEVTNDGGAEVTERGICWSTNANPSLNDNHIASGTGTGAFTTMMDSLAASTTYHVRAYATNEKGTAYGLDREFVTASIVVLPTVTTADVSGITSNSAQCGGEVTNDGGAEVTERGICWSTNENPNLSDSHIAVGSGTGTFNYSINGLTANTTYHVRAYATNEAGTVYGSDESFLTLAPAGAIRGLFTVNNNGDQVYFSQGNLQYQASSNTWRFAEHQWDFVGGIDTITGEEHGNVFDNGIKSDNALISPSYDGWIDLYGWASNGHDHGAVCYQPWSTSVDYNDYHAYGGFSYNLYDQTGQAEWGYNAISNGGNVEDNGWRTPTWEEWHYVFFSRTTVSDIRFAKGIVNGVMGVILLPDEWDVNIYALNDVNQEYAFFTSNEITQSDWEEFLEVNGVAFLPAAGIRYKSAYYLYGQGHYWSSSTFNDELGAYDLDFSDNFLETDNYGTRYFGHMVRLVIDNNP